ARRDWYGRPCRPPRRARRARARAGRRARVSRRRRYGAGCPRTSGMSLVLRSSLPVNVAALWHDLECGGYREDLPLWRALAAESGGGPGLDVGAGTGRVTLDPAAQGVSGVAVDTEAALLAPPAHRAAGAPGHAVGARARDFALERRFTLIAVPMQTLQLFGGPDGRAAFLRCALTHLEPGGLVAAALADAMDCFDDEHDTPPPPDACDILDVRYAS